MEKEALLSLIEYQRVEQRLGGQFPLAEHI